MLSKVCVTAIVVIVASTASALLTGCSEKQHDVSYYGDHASERVQKIAECAKQPASPPLPNCIAASTASYKAVNDLHDVSYYEAHPEDRAAELKACASFPQGAWADKNCETAAGSKGTH